MQPAPVLARMAPPVQAPRIERPPLLRALLAAQKRPVCLVVAGPGYGKTQTLGLLWRHWPARRAWLDLDPLDAEVENLLPALLQALDAAGVEAPGQPLPRRWLHEPEGVVDEALNWMAQALGSGEGDTVLYLDDVQHIQSGSSGLRLIERLLGYLPPRVHVVMAGRAAPPLPWERWRVQGRSVEIGEDQLRMDAGEIARLFATIYGIALSREGAAELEAGTTGWPAALLLLQYNLQPRSEAAVLERLRRAAAPGLGIYEYLLAEVMAGLAAGVEEFLVRSSALPELEPGLCDRLLGRSDSGQILEHLHRSGLFTTRSPAAQPYYSYHPLLRQVLRQRLAAGDPTAGPRLAGAAAAVYEARGDLMIALDCWLEAGQHREAARLLLYILETSAYPKLRTLALWLSRFPASLLETDAMLLLARGYIDLRQANQDVALRLGERALQIARQSGEHTVLVRVLAATATFALIAGDRDHAAELLQEVRQLLPTGDPFTDTRAAITINLVFPPDDPLDLLDILEVAYSSFVEMGATAEQIQTLTTIVQCQVQAGRFREAISSLEKLQALTATQTDTSAHLEALLGLAISHRYLWDYAAAERVAEAALVPAVEKRELDTQWALLLLLSRIQLETGRLSLAWETAEKAEAMPVKGRAKNAAELHLLHCQLHLAAGDTTAARAEVDRSLALSAGWAQAAPEWMVGVVAMAAGEWAEALSLVRQMLGQLPRGRRYHRWRCHLGLAYIGLKSDRLDEAAIRQSLAQVVTLGESEGYALIPRHPEMEAVVFAACQERSIQSPYVRAALRRVTPAAEPADATSGLSPREIEVMHLVVQGLTNREIAQRLGIGEVTVKTHNQRLFEKLGVRNRTELVARVLSGGMPLPGN